MAVTDNSSLTTQEGIPVMLPSGAYTKVQNQDEVDYVLSLVDRYLDHNQFSNISDIQDVDRMITLELQVWRMGNFLNRGGLDYFNHAVDEAEHHRAIIGMSGEIRQVKKLLGIDKTARDKEKGEGSLAAYIERLPQRAEQFGIHRDAQNAKIMELGMQLIALATWHHNCTDEERRELGITLEDLYKWIREVFEPTLVELDAHFRQNQKMWIQEL